MRFDVIYSDVPWEFSAWSEKGKSRSAENHYNVMSLKEIAELPVSSVASKNAVLFFWVTYPNLFDAPAILDAWGFSYRTVAFTWAKTTKLGFVKLFDLVQKIASRRAGQDYLVDFIESIFWHIGNGYYTRANAEICLLAVRKGGKAPVESHSVRQLIVAPVGRHSEKPVEAYERIEQLYPNRSCLELFARESRPGWVSLGNEINGGLDIRESLAQLASDSIPAVYV